MRSERGPRIMVMASLGTVVLLELFAVTAVVYQSPASDLVVCWMILVRGLQVLLLLAAAFGARSALTRVLIFGLAGFVALNLAMRGLYVVGDLSYAQGQRSLAAGHATDAQQSFSEHQAAYQSPGIQVEPELRLTAHGLVRNREGEIQLDLGLEEFKHGEHDAAMRHFEAALAHARQYDPDAVGEIEALVRDVAEATQ